MKRKTVFVFIVFSIFLATCLPTANEPPVTTIAQIDPYADISGDWATELHQLYLMYGTTITFSDDLRDADKVLWLRYTEESLELLPVHLRDKLNGLLISFNSGNTCVEDNYLGCFTRYNFSIFVSTTKQFRERDNLRTILHEMGHAIDERLNPRIGTFSDELHNNKPRLTNYSGKNQYEDFAESFSIYILSPGYMFSKSTARYEFMRDKVFLGKEYFDK